MMSLFEAVRAEAHHGGWGEREVMGDRAPTAPQPTAASGANEENSLLQSDWPPQPSFLNESGQGKISKRKR